MINDFIKEKISLEVIKVLINPSDTFSADASSNYNSPFHDAIFDSFNEKISNYSRLDVSLFISLSSWVQRINANLGKSFFESIAHHLSNGFKKQYTAKKSGNLQITQTQKSNISQIITDLSSGAQKPSLERENELIFIKDDGSELVNAIDFSADVFIEDDDSVTAIELKSVKPNSGEMRGEKQKILEGKAALYRQFPGKQINFYLGFPFDPTVNNQQDCCSYDKTRFFNSIINLDKSFAHNETLLSSELWDFLSDEQNTMQQILGIINAISTTNFLDKFRLINNRDNFASPAYQETLQEWSLISELNLVENDIRIKQAIQGNRNLTRIYNKLPFDNKGNYNFDRYITLTDLVRI